MPVSNKPRPYSTFSDGRIVWVAPGEKAPDRKVRSRRETDSEVLSRIAAEHRRLKTANPWQAWFPRPIPASPQGLDNELKELGLEPRKWIDEAA